MASLQVKRGIGSFHVNAADFLENFLKKPLVDVEDVLHVHEGQLHVDLSKFRLAVCPQILVAVAACKLEVAVEAGAHEKLL